MIKSLFLKNFIIVDNLQLYFTKGLNVLTGETGVGKSVILGALNQILGEKTKNNLLFDKSKESILEIVFTSESCKNIINDEFGVDASEDILLTKRIAINGRSKTYLNRCRINNSQIKRLRELLVDYHSQSQHLRIYEQNYQLNLLDSFAKNENILKDYTTAFGKLKRDKSKLNKLEKDRELIKKNRAFYQFQIEEINEANLSKDEEGLLHKELNILSFAKEIKDALEELEVSFFESDSSIYNKINSMIRRLDRFSENSLEIVEIINSLKDSLANINSSVDNSRSLIQTISLQPHRVAQIEKRLDILSQLKEKYKLDICGILEYKKKLNILLQKEKEKIEYFDNLKEKVQIEETTLQKISNKLTQRRNKSAKILVKKINSIIKNLAMKQAEFSITSSEKQDFSSTGKDNISFLFSANRDITTAKLKGAISGGELSRLALAIKSVISQSGRRKSFIFDEIDAGIGGEVANYVGKYIKSISTLHQTFCVTHLSQIAALSDTHFLIKKKEVAKRTVVNVKLLNDETKKIEIARMLSGTATKVAIKHAEEILEIKN